MTDHANTDALVARIKKALAGITECEAVGWPPYTMRDIEHWHNEFDAALDVLVRERDEAREKCEFLSAVTVMCPDCDGAGEVQVPERAYCHQCDGQGVVESPVYLDLLREARAENERLRLRYGSFLGWAIGFVSSTVEPDDPEAEWFEIRRSWLHRLEGQLWEERAALAAAQEPPAIECPDCGLDLEPGETHGQHPDAGCVAQEPPADGGDRDA